MIYHSNELKIPYHETNTNSLKIVLSTFISKVLTDS
jgi:hypothetical protein